MDQALARFRNGAARANGNRRGPKHLQHQVVEYWRTRQRQGEGLRDVAAALGVAPWSLHRWTRASKKCERFHEVQIVAPASRPSDAAPVLIRTTDGVRVEGLDVDAAAQLLRLLR